MIDNKKKLESLIGVLQRSNSLLDQGETNELFKLMINPIRNPVGYADIRSSFKVNPLCSECYMEFESDEACASHTLEECTTHKVHNS
jgi:hypothetical protein